MVKNKFGGNKAKSVARKNASHSKKELIIRDINEEYVKVIKMLGDRRLLGVLPNNREILAHIPNRIRKRIFIGDIILVVPQIEGVDSKKFSVIFTYENEQVRELIKLNELDKSFAKVDHLNILDENNTKNYNNESDDDEDNEDIGDIPCDEEEDINLDDI